jgi:hypothetical protein
MPGGFILITGVDGTGGLFGSNQSRSFASRSSRLRSAHGPVTNIGGKSNQVAIWVLNQKLVDTRLDIPGPIPLLFGVHE